VADQLYLLIFMFFDTLNQLLCVTLSGKTIPRVYFRMNSDQEYIRLIGCLLQLNKMCCLIFFAFDFLTYDFH